MLGLINLNKPSGMTSRRAVDIVARVAKTKRAGHAGTLDPLAEGVLVICLGWATRLVPFVQERPKRYRAEFLLGQRSDTDDVTGVVEEIAGAPMPTREQVAAHLPKFTGRIAQVPPDYSAVHVDGQRAYDRARRGDELKLAPREVHIYRLELAAYDYPRLDLLIECGSGTYVRALGRDLGEALGCGAVMSALTREAVGDFRLSEAVRPDEITPDTISRHLSRPRTAVDHLPKHTCSSDELREIASGRSIACARELSLSIGQRVAAITPDGALAAICEVADDDRLQPRLVFPAGERGA